MKKIWILILFLIVGAIGFIYFSPSFEREAPTIKIYTNGFTNLKNPIKIEIKDNRGIKEYQVIAKGDNFEEVISKAAEPNLGKDVVLNVNLPNINTKNIKLIVIAKDTSNWHFFRGNQAIKEVLLKVDTTPPDAEVIANSYAIGRGGSAVAVVRAVDDNLKDTYILVNGKYKFKLTPFVKKGYYVSLLAWPINEKRFDAELIAEDLAGNKIEVHIPYYWRKYRYPHKKLKITDRFIRNVAYRVIQKMGMKIPDNPIEAFKLENETIRKLNEEEIKKLTMPTDKNKIVSFYINRFNPLPGSKKEAGYGEFRDYYYKGKLISHSIHRGMDLAKIRHAKIYDSNNGKVIATKYLGIYGNTIIIYHQLGLYSLYAHTSEFRVKPNQFVRKGQVIALTGSTGGVFGDHLHFGVYIQGIAVNPLEWMDSHWIKVNILRIIYAGKRTILQ